MLFANGIISNNKVGDFDQISYSEPTKHIEEEHIGIK